MTPTRRFNILSARTFAWGLVPMIGLAASAATVRAQGSPDMVAVYGRGVHAYFANQLQNADQQLSYVINAGSTDPRAYYFRAMARLRAGRRYEAAQDMQVGAMYEARDPGAAGHVGQALTRIQGPHRQLLEQYRRQGRLVLADRNRALSQARYEQSQNRETQVLRQESQVELDQLAPQDSSAAAAAPPAIAPPAVPTPQPELTEDPAPPADDDPFAADAADSPSPTPPTADAAAEGGDPFAAPQDAAPTEPDAADPFGAGAEATPDGPEVDAARDGGTDPFSAPDAAGDDPFGTNDAADAMPTETSDAGDAGLTETPPTADAADDEAAPGDATDSFGAPTADDAPADDAAAAPPVEEMADPFGAGDAAAGDAEDPFSAAAQRDAAAAAARANADPTDPIVETPAAGDAEPSQGGLLGRVIGRTLSGLTPSIPSMPGYGPGTPPAAGSPGADQFELGPDASPTADGAPAGDDPFGASDAGDAARDDPFSNDAAANADSGATDSGASADGGAEASGDDPFGDTGEDPFGGPAEAMAPETVDGADEELEEAADQSAQASEELAEDVEEAGDAAAEGNVSNQQDAADAAEGADAGEDPFGGF